MFQEKLDCSFNATEAISYPTLFPEQAEAASRSQAKRDHDRRSSSHVIFLQATLGITERQRQ